MSQRRDHAYVCNVKKTPQSCARMRSYFLSNAEPHVTLLVLMSVVNSCTKLMRLINMTIYNIIKMKRGKFHIK